MCPDKYELKQQVLEQLINWYRSTIGPQALYLVKKTFVRKKNLG